MLVDSIILAMTTADGPVVPIMLIVGFLSAGGALWLELNFHPSIWLHLIIWPPFILLLSLALLRPFKALFIGAQFKLRAEAVISPTKTYRKRRAEYRYSAENRACLL